jgi:hypothetical protein
MVALAGDPRPACVTRIDPIGHWHFSGARPGAILRIEENAHARRR